MGRLTVLPSDIPSSGWLARSSQALGRPSPEPPRWCRRRHHCLCCHMPRGRDRRQERRGKARGTSSWWEDLLL